MTSFSCQAKGKQFFLSNTSLLQMCEYLCSSHLSCCRPIIGHRSHSIPTYHCRAVSSSIHRCKNRLACLALTTFMTLTNRSTGHFSVQERNEVIFNVSEPLTIYPLVRSIIPCLLALKYISLLCDDESSYSFSLYSCFFSGVADLSKGHESRYLCSS